jgi:hypothetical protein
VTIGLRHCSSAINICFAALERFVFTKLNLRKSAQSVEKILQVSTQKSAPVIGRRAVLTSEFITLSPSLTRLL